MLTATNYKYMNFTASKVACFISVDPLQFKYPELTPFQYASNRPISGIDLDGAEFVDPNEPGEVIILKKGSWFASRVRQELAENPARALHIARIATNININPKNKWEEKIYGKDGGFAATYYDDNDEWGSIVYEGSVSEDNLIHRFPVSPMETPYEGYKRLGLMYAKLNYDNCKKSIQNQYLKAAGGIIGEVDKVTDQMFAVALAAEGGLALSALGVPVFSTGTFGTKFGISAITQFSLFGQDADVADMLFDGLLTPGWSAWFGGVVDFAPFRGEDQFASVFYNKSATEFSVDFGSGLIFDSFGDFKINTLSPNLVNGFEKNLFNIIYNTPISVGKYGTNQAIKENK